MKDEKTEKVIEEARRIFLRYGFRRATMGDIADAAKMSRPALYLVFGSKEEILTAVMGKVCGEMLAEIRTGINDFETEEKRLRFAFEIWSVRPFEIMQASPDARDLLESSYEFADRVTSEAFADFENIVSEILKPLIDSQSAINLASSQVAHILTAAVKGFKDAAKDSDELRQMISDLLLMLLESLNRPNPAAKKQPTNIAKSRLI